MKRIFLYNLGCSKNIIDGENISGFLKASGFKVAEDPEEADIIIVNTCAFIIEAKQEAIDTILEAGVYKREAKCSVLVVAGCFSQRYREEVGRSFPEVDLWTGVDDWEEALKNYFDLSTESGFYRDLSMMEGTGYVKISEGCSHSCSFCVIPSIRGGFRSRSVESVVKETWKLQERGVNELILVSQDTSFFGRDMGLSLAQLLKHLVRETDFEWIRAMYLHPAYVDNELLDVIGSEERICSYFDIPLQHISDRILKSMGRFPLSEGIIELLERIRRYVPGAGLRTSFILGYPGESEQEFNELVEFVEESGFDKVGVFPFSPEEGTRAFEIKEQVPEETANERCSILMDIQRDISSSNLRERIGNTERVIIDRVSDDKGFEYEGRTEFDSPEIDGRVFLKTENGLNPGDMVYARITDADDYDLFGEA